MRSDIEYIKETLSPAARWGQLAEECCELAQAASKLQRLAMGENLPRKMMWELKEQLTEEIADLENALCCAEFLPSRQAIKEVRKDKMARWAADVHKHMMEQEDKDGH